MIPVTQDPATATGPAEAAQVGGSFRDPSGACFRRGDILYRQVNACWQGHYDKLMTGGLYDELADAGLLVAHREVQVPAAEGEAHKVIQPQAVPFISYPYEWCFSQLKDAALLTLDVQQRALRRGMTLKDASAYNVQFVGSRCVFIDTLSFETYREGSPWLAYGQFCRHFLAPLALMARRDVRLGQLLRAHIDGIPLDLADRLLGWRGRLSPSLWMHIHLHAAAQKQYEQTPGAAAGRKVRRMALLGLIDSLATAVRRLHWRPAATPWADYYQATNYSADALDHKARLVAAMLDRLRARTVWDLGANTGVFSRLASQRGSQTVAMDMDPAAVEKSYLGARTRGDGKLLPLLMDLANPSGEIGWANQERMSLAARGPADAAMALALVHHLAIGNNVPLGRIATFMASLCGSLIIEFIPKEDSQVSRMLAGCEDVFADYSQEAFERHFARHFRIEECQPVEGSRRMLYLMTAAGGAPSGNGESQ